MHAVLVETERPGFQNAHGGLALRVQRYRARHVLPPLRLSGARHSAEWIAAYLENPAKDDPNTQMPAFDKFAYSDGRCYGKKQADLKSYPTRMPDPPATLQQREIDLLADFLLAKIVGKGPMDHAKCVEFWGSETDACKEFSK